MSYDLNASFCMSIEDLILCANLLRKDAEKFSDAGADDIAHYRLQLANRMTQEVKARSVMEISKVGV